MHSLRLNRKKKREEKTNLWANLNSLVPPSPCTAWGVGKNEESEMEELI